MINSNDDDFIEEDEKSAAQSASEFARMFEESTKKSAKKLSVGDKLDGEILVIGKEDVFVATGTQNDGTLSRREIQDAEGNLTHKVGDRIKVFVTLVRGTDIQLSTNKTSKNLADDLEDAFDRMLAVEGKVAEICKGGVRVLVKGKLAFCPISQLDTARVETGEEYIGKKLEFRITQYSEGGRNIVVSRRKLLEEQREEGMGNFLTEHRAGEIVQGKVARLEKFGAFIELAPGIDGMAHISELAWSRVADPAEVLTVGSQVQVKILKIETDERGRPRIGLSIKQAGVQPWDTLSQNEGVKEGQVVTGKVTKCMKFGAFVEIAPGIEGLVPLGEMSYTKRVMTSDELFKEGDKIEVMIKEINPETQKILLSFKDAGAGDPWTSAVMTFPVGRILSGKIERKEAYGLFVRLDDTIVGLLPKSKADAGGADFKYEKQRVGDAVTVQVAEVRPEERRISLDLPNDAGTEEWKNYEAKQKAATSFGSFGSLGGGAMAEQLKKAMEKKK